MNQTKILTTRLLTLAAVLVPLQSASATPLPQDDRVQSGKLANGVTWKFRQHSTPEEKMAVIMHVRTGSLNETDAQQGLAHFIEHMAFNGSENFAPGDLIPYFESIGMEFGGDLNAFTGFDQTASRLSCQSPLKASAFSRACLASARALDWATASGHNPNNNTNTNRPVRILALPSTDKRLLFSMTTPTTITSSP